MSDNVKDGRQARGAKQVKRDRISEKKGESSENDNKEEKAKEEPIKQETNEEEKVKQEPIKQETNKEEKNIIEANKQETNRQGRNKPGRQRREGNREEEKVGKNTQEISRQETDNQEESKEEAREEEVREEKNKEEDEEREKQTEHYAVIPPNGGWGWMVVLTAFYCNVVTDGIQFTYGVFMESISKSFDEEFSKIALAGSMMFGIHLLMGFSNFFIQACVVCDSLHYINIPLKMSIAVEIGETFGKMEKMGPLCSGVTSVFGLRLVTVIGALICSVGVALAYFATNFWILCITYGLIGGIGLGFVYMNSLVITGLYFTTLMPVAIGIVVCGTGVGTMIFAVLGYFLLNITTWQNVMLINALLSATMALAALAFKPLEPIRVKISESQTYLPPQNVGSVESTTSMTKSVFIKKEVPVRLSITSTRTMQSYIWNAVLQNTVLTELERQGRSKCCRCCRCCRCRCCKCCRRKRKKKDSDILVLSEIKHDIIRSEIDRRRSYVEKPESDSSSPASSVVPSLYQEKKPKTQAVFERVEYQKSATRNFCSQLKKSLIATMDCHLLASCAFFFIHTQRSLANGLPSCCLHLRKRSMQKSWFHRRNVSIFCRGFGRSEYFWRLFLGGIAVIPKINSHLIAILAITIGGIATLCSGLSDNIYYQFAFCFFYSLGMASFAVFRLVLLLEIVKPEETPNATGINLLFMGFFSIIAPPLCGWAMELTHSYDVIFLTSGFIIIASAILLIGVKKLRRRELEKLNDHL